MKNEKEKTPRLAGVAVASSFSIFILPLEIPAAAMPRTRPARRNSTNSTNAISR
jgi:hypothetical protein